MTLNLVDGFIVIIMFCALTVVGMRVRKFVRGVEDFLVAGRKMRKWIGLSTSNAEAIGLIGIAAISQQGFLHGYSFVWIALIWISVYGVIYGIFGFGIERFRASRAITLAEYFEMRYSRKLRILTGIIMAVGGILNMAIFPVIGAKFLVAFTGIPESIQALGLQVKTIWLLMVILLSLAVFFTFLGGMVTVLVTDFVQSIFIVFGLFILAFIILRNIGINTMWNGLGQRLGQGAYNPFIEGSYGVMWLLWTFLNGLFMRVSFSPYLQRVASADTPKEARLITLFSTIFGGGRGILYLTLGAGALVAVGNQVSGGMNAADYKEVVVPLYLNQIVPPILMGLLLGSLFFADISTTDSYLLVWGTVIVNDILLPLRKNPFSTRAHITAVRWVIIGLAFFFLLFGIAYKPTMPILEYMLLTGNIVLGGGIILLSGLYWKSTTTAGAYTVVLTSLILPLMDVIVRRLWAGYPFKAEQTGLFTIVLAIVLLVIVSLYTKEKGTRFVDYSSIVRQSERND
ncbi:MAG: sodium:solute symporter family protein [Planctomycetota bacterium]